MCESVCVLVECMCYLALEDACWTRLSFFFSGSSGLTGDSNSTTLNTQEVWPQQYSTKMFLFTCCIYFSVFKSLCFLSDSIYIYIDTHTHTHPSLLFLQLCIFAYMTHNCFLHFWLHAQYLHSILTIKSVYTYLKWASLLKGLVMGTWITLSW